VGAGPPCRPLLKRCQSLRALQERNGALCAPAQVQPDDSRS